MEQEMTTMAIMLVATLIGLCIVYISDRSNRDKAKKLFNRKTKTTQKTEERP